MNPRRRRHQRNRRSRARLLALVTRLSRETMTRLLRDRPIMIVRGAPTVTLSADGTTASISFRADKMMYEKTISVRAEFRP